MDALTADAVRRSMINCTQGDAKRMTVADGVVGADLDTVEFVGWHDPRMPQRAYLVTEVAHPEFMVAGCSPWDGDDPTVVRTSSATRRISLLPRRRPNTNQDSSSWRSSTPTGPG